MPRQSTPHTSIRTDDIRDAVIRGSQEIASILDGAQAAKVPGAVWIGEDVRRLSFGRAASEAVTGELDGLGLTTLVAAHELVEIAFFAAGRFVLVDEREIVIVEFLEELIPTDFLKRLIAATAVAWELQADHPRIPAPAGPLYAGGFAAVLFRPTPDLIMVRRGLREVPRTARLGAVARRGARARC